eukprot:764449-Hanusia_phi.AAC.1
MEWEARLAGDRARDPGQEERNLARKAKKRAGETPVHREARLHKEAQNRAQRLFDDSFALAGRAGMRQGGSRAERRPWCNGGD